MSHIDDTIQEVLKVVKEKKIAGPGVRWEKGMPHHPMSEEIIKAISQLDFIYGSDSLQLEVGGDGDNGEHMMYLADMYFEALAVSGARIDADDASSFARFMGFAQ